MIAPHQKLRHGPLRVGIGGPVGAGKTSMTEALCRALSPSISMAVITNDIYTRELMLTIWSGLKRLPLIG